MTRSGPAAIEAAHAGRVVERLVPARSRVTVTLADGSTDSETGCAGCCGIVPLPGWTRWGREVVYAPYSSASSRR